MVHISQRLGRLQPRDEFLEVAPYIFGKARENDGLPCCDAAAKEAGKSAHGFGSVWFGPDQCGPDCYNCDDLVFPVADVRTAEGVV